MWNKETYLLILYTPQQTTINLALWNNMHFALSLKDSVSQESEHSSAGPQFRISGGFNLVLTGLHSFLKLGASFLWSFQVHMVAGRIQFLLVVRLKPLLVLLPSPKGPSIPVQVVLSKLFSKYCRKFPQSWQEKLFLSPVLCNVMKSREWLSLTYADLLTRSKSKCPPALETGDYGRCDWLFGGLLQFFLSQHIRLLNL